MPARRARRLWERPRRSRSRRSSLAKRDILSPPIGSDDLPNRGRCHLISPGDLANRNAFGMEPADTIRVAGCELLHAMPATPVAPVPLDVLAGDPPAP